MSLFQFLESTRDVQNHVMIATKKCKAAMLEKVTISKVITTGQFMLEELRCRIYVQLAQPAANMRSHTSVMLTVTATTDPTIIAHCRCAVHS